MGVRTRDHRIPTRQSLPRACKESRPPTTVYDVYHVESERVYECTYCGRVVPNRDPTRTGAHYFRSEPKSKALQVRSDHDIECAICLNPKRYKRMLVLVCKHRFHKKCVVEWFRVDKRCPMCRE